MPWNPVFWVEIPDFMKNFHTDLWLHSVIWYHCTSWRVKYHVGILKFKAYKSHLVLTFVLQLFVWHVVRYLGRGWLRRWVGMLRGVHLLLDVYGLGDQGQLAHQDGLATRTKHVRHSHRPTLRSVLVRGDLAPTWNKDNSAWDTCNLQGLKILNNCRRPYIT